MRLPEQITRDRGTSAISDARRIRVTHEGHTVSERTYFVAGDDLPEVPSEPLRFILAPVDDLVERHLGTSVRPQLDKGQLYAVRLPWAGGERRAARRR